MVHIKVVISRIELFLEEGVSLLIIVLEMSMDNFVGYLSSSISVKEKATRCFTLVVLHFKGVVLDQRIHQSIISFFCESLWHFSIVSSSGISSSEVWDEVINLVRLEVSPVVMEVA